MEIAYTRCISKLRGKMMGRRLRYCYR